MLLVDDPIVGVPELLSADRAALLKCLDRINPTEASGDAQRALTRAFDLLHKSTAQGGVVHVFTDLQQVEWAENRGEGVPPLRVAGILPANRGQDALATKSKGKMPSPRLEAAEDRVHVYLHKIGTSPTPHANVAVTAVQLPEQRILVGQPYEVGLSLHNNSDLPAEVRVNCLNGQGQRSTQSVSLQKQEIATVRLPVTVNEQGYHWLKAWVEGDGFAADNTAGIGLFCEGTGTVLFVGRPREFGVLPMAISPSGRGQLTGLVTKFAPSIQDVGWASAHADNSEAAGQEPHGLKPILLVTTWGALAAAGSNPTELTKYVESGGNLLIVPSLMPGSDTSAVQAPAWLGAGVHAREAYKTGVRLAILSRDAPFWHQIEQVIGDVSAEPVAVYAFCPLDLSAGLTPLLGAGTKKVILAHKAVGKGNVFVSGVAFSPRWSTLPLSGLGVVMAQRMAVCRWQGIKRNAWRPNARSCRWWRGSVRRLCRGRAKRNWFLCPAMPWNGRAARPTCPPSPERESTWPRPEVKNAASRYGRHPRKVSAGLWKARMCRFWARSRTPSYRSMPRRTTRRITRARPESGSFTSRCSCSPPWRCWSKGSWAQHGYALP